MLHWSNFFLEYLILPLADKLNKSPFHSKLKMWREVSLKKEREIGGIQKEKLEKILNHATQASTFYKNQQIIRQQDPYEWLKSFPIFSKKSFRDNVDEVVTVPITSQLHAITSSGSSGPPSKVYFNKEEIANNRALQILWWEWSGYKFGNSVLQTGVNMNRPKEKQLKDLLLKTRYIDAISHSEADILEELYRLKKEPRDHFVAYASSLFLFAKVALEHQITGITFKSIISLGEKLLPTFRNAIEQAFSCLVFDTYGASEGFLIASQCNKGEYHILTPHLVLEILDDNDQEVETGQVGRVILTGLDNYTTPLIRYEVGDLARKSSKKQCSCGLAFPILEEIIGRQTEFILTPKGKYITVQTVVKILKQFPEIEQFKVVQDKPSEMCLFYIADSSAEIVRIEEIKNAFQVVFAEKLLITFEQVRILPKAKTGKFQLIERNF